MMPHSELSAMPSGKLRDLKIQREGDRDQSLEVTFNLVMCFIMTLFGNEVMNYCSVVTCVFTNFILQFDVGLFDYSIIVAIFFPLIHFDAYNFL